MPINLGKQLKDFQRGKKALMRTIGNNGVKMFKLNNFEAQGFIDSGVRSWKPKKKKDGDRLLIKTSKLRNGIFYKASGTKIAFGTIMKYGQYHNEGTRKLPKRQFMGDSEALNKINNKDILKFTKKHFS